MFRRLFGLDWSAGPSADEALYSAIVAAARRPGFYAGWGVADTPLGRFEMLSLHMFLFLHRIRNDESARYVGQKVADEFFLDVDHSLRELGIGDMAIPKRVRKLARMFYGRLVSYGDALDGNDRDLLRAALARNIMPDQPSWRHAGALADYVFAARDALAGQPVDGLLSGSLIFPSPARSSLAEAPA